MKDITKLITSIYTVLTKEELIDLYKGRCVRCGSGNVTVHEIEYKSERPKTWMQWENQVPLCYDCHNLVHTLGERAREDLYKFQNQRLLTLYGRTINRP